MLTGRAVRQPWPCYQALRRLNPAPYGAWLAFGGGGPQVIDPRHCPTGLGLACRLATVTPQEDALSTAQGLADGGPLGLWSRLHLFIGLQATAAQNADVTG